MLGAPLISSRRYAAALSTVSVFCCTMFGGTMVAAQSTAWNGGTGFWTDAHWTNGVPDATTNAQIDHIIGINSVVSLAGASEAKNLTVDTNDQLDFSGETLTLHDTSLANNGAIKASGPLNFATNGGINGSGTLIVSSTVTAAQLANTGLHTIQLGDVAGSSGVLDADTIINGSLITTGVGASQADLVAESITNLGMMRTVSSSFAIRTPTLINNGVIEITGSAGSLRLNQDDFAGGVQVTGNGRWYLGVETSMLILYPTVIATAGEFNIEAGALLLLTSEAAGSSISMSTLLGVGSISGTDYTLKILDGDPWKPFAGSIMSSGKVIKTGTGTQVISSQQEYTGGTLIQGGTLEVNTPNPASPASTGVGYGDLRVQDGGTLAGSGAAGGFSFVEDGGTLAPGVNGPGEFHFFALDLQDGARLDLELGNDTPSDFVYAHNGEFLADGVGVRVTDIGLEVGVTTWFLDWTGALIGITPGNTITESDFALVNSGSIEGSFVVDLVGERVGFLPTNLLQLTGDYNYDGVVNGADYVVWRKTLGQDVAPGTGPDGNGDGFIDESDYTVWRSNFGSGAAGSGIGSGAASVPEPTAGLLLLISVALVFMGRPRHRPICSRIAAT